MANDNKVPKPSRMGKSLKAKAALERDKAAKKLKRTATDKATGAKVFPSKDLAEYTKADRRSAEMNVTYGTKGTSGKTIAGGSKWYNEVDKARKAKAKKP